MELDKRRTDLKKNMKSFSDFAQQNNTSINDEVSIDQEKQFAVKTLGKARPGKANLPTVTFRVNQEQWERLKLLAIQERTTIQNIAEQAFSSEFKRRGLPW